MLSEIADLLPDWATGRTTALAEPTYTDKWAGNTTPALNTAEDVIAYSWLYQTDETFAAYHYADSITIAFTSSASDANVLGTDFQGIGTATHPFEGTIKLGSSGSYAIQTHRAFFSYISDKARVTDANANPVYMKLIRLSSVGDNSSAPLFADHVVHYDDSENEGTNAVTQASGWKVEIDGSNTFSGAIGEIGAGAIVKLDFKNTANTNVVANAAYNANDASGLTDAGLFAGSIGEGADYTVIYTGSIDKEVSSANGNAGTFVGTMGANSSLTVVTSLTSISPSVNANGLESNDKGYAGGLVGKTDSTSVIHLKTTENAEDSALSALTIGGTVTGTTGAGGLYGYYELQDIAGDSTVPGIDLKDYNVTAKSYAKYCGGLFGVLYTPGDVSITNTDSSSKTFTSGTGSTFETTGYYGGVAGRFITSALTNTATLTNLSISPKADTKFNAFGGVFGIVDSAAYVKANAVTVKATGTNKREGSPAFFGGLVGATSSANGVFIDLGNFNLETGSESYQGGGVVGQFVNGVLRFSGITNMSKAKCASGDNCGQLVGNNNNVLVYSIGNGSNGTAYGSGWTFKRSDSAKADDLGTWGEVVRGITDSSNANTVYFDSSAHTATVAASVISMDSADDFVRTALNIQLNQGSDYDCLKFTSGSGTRTNLLKNSGLTISGDFSLAGTGITGFMRDGGDVNTIGAFTGTLDGTNGTDVFTVTLATGEVYGLDSTGAAVTTATEGAGRIYRHRHTGLFAVIGNGTTAGTVSNLEIAGSITVRNLVDGMNIGTVASRNGGNVTITNVIAGKTVTETEGNVTTSTPTLTINYHESSNVTGTETAGKNVGGYIGFVGANGTITINGVSSVGAKFAFTGNNESWNVYGGAIGKITASAFTVNIGTKNDPTNKLTVSLDADVTGVTAGGGNTDSGGLIGRIINVDNAYTNYNERIVNLNNVEFDGCKIGNAASTNAGGFLGYSWLNTTANFNGVTISGDSAINNSGTSSNIGIMCYEATGKWNVDSLTVSKMTMSSGGGTSLGFLVNKAYNTSNSITQGLYLNVLKSGYVLADKNGNTGITLPSSLGIYDEIAAYSAPSEGDVLKGGAGVISINMNTDRNGTETRISNYTTSSSNENGTGTYQNQLTSASSSALDNTKYANKLARYYYNVDVLGTTDDAENILLWSLYKYAASNIQDEFKNGVGTNTSFGTTLTNTLSGTADMTGLSFYPVALADGVTIGTLTLTFDYSGLSDTTSSAETIYNSTYNKNDSYVRDPGAANQHYLMHSGLFLNSSAGKTLTINGALSLKGSFLEVGKYKGVLISDTMRGAFTCTSGSILLNGITPKTTGNTNYTGGYLLINNINRADSIVSIPELKLYNVSTGAGYTAGTTVAKSLIGQADGPGLKMTFSKIKLDGRNSADGTQGLNTAYSTTRSIFTDSTILASILTDQDAQLIYNYTHDNDWGADNRCVTYGYEVSGSLEYPSQEAMYYDQDYYTHPTTQQSGSAYTFSGYLPYVKTAYGTAAPEGSNYFYREIKVNVVASGLIFGCGTYNDPYLISNASQLNSVAKFIKDGNIDDLGKIKLPKNEPTSKVSGNKWCNNKEDHDIYNKYDASNFKLESGSTKSSWTVTDVREYLASAYYKINNSEIVLDSNFVGLGGTTANTAWRGVIVGSGTNNGVPSVTIRIKTDKPFINVSNGCVVKDISFVVESDISLTLDNVYNSSAKKYYIFGYGSELNGYSSPYYGGIIGEIMGGDNIIDNSYVSYKYKDENNADQTSVITLNGTNGGTSIPVGGYVGVIVFGGLIFKNMTVTDTVGNNTVLRVNNSNLTVKYTGKTYNLADNSDDEAWAAIYVNPIVGRIINGYAVNETTQLSVTENNKYHDDGKSDRTGTQHTLKNGTKHYSIADINKNETKKLEVASVAGNSDGVINIPNTQALFVLSLITQSCAGTAQSANGVYNTSLSYGNVNGIVYGMSHIATYSDVGNVATNVTPSSVTDYNNLASKDTAGNTAATNSAPADIAIPYIIRWYTASDSSGNYPARCVTSTAGYYDINLTGKTANSTTTDANDQVVPLDEYKYQLPDSFRGLGSVGNYDYNDTLKSNSFSMKVNVFEGNGCTIDEDVYLNKFKVDNYFDYMHKGTSQAVNSDTSAYSANTNADNHGIGLFDSIISKDGTNMIGNFTLTGSVNTDIYSNTYKVSGQEEVFVGNAKSSLWLSVGGVVGWSKGRKYNDKQTATVNDSYQQVVSFNNIALNNLSLCGDDFVGGLLAYSGLYSKTKKITITECSANNISVKMSSANYGDDSPKARNAIGCFVGKVQEGAVIIYGTSQLDRNSDLNKFSTVKIRSYGFGNPSLEYRVAVGGLVGYAGNGCQAYDMKISSYDSAVTIGLNSAPSYVGGIVGAMQPSTDGDTNCLAVFKNCTIENINIVGQYAGGLYGGKWAYNNFNPYKIEINHCSLIGNETPHNTISAKNYAGGFIAWAFVQRRNGDEYNIHIYDSTISNYSISSAANGCSGGFIGYCQAKNNSITCYIHDSSVENCEIGLGGKDKDYAGGIIGGIQKHADNRILGYNIKLDNVSSPNTNRKGTWIGSVSTDANNKTYIQFSGMAVYGDSYNFTQNVGSGTADSSFVFADYSGQSYGNTTTTRMTVSGTDVFTLDSTNKTILRTVSQNVTTDSKTENRMQVYKYSYSTEPEGTAAEAAAGWSISDNTITRIADGKQYAYTVTLTENEIYSLNASDKVITRQIISGASTRTINYNYTVVPEGTATTDSDQWSIDETNGKITRIVGGQKYEYTIAVSGLNKGTTVTMPKYPFVNINPQSKLGSSEIISGDGAVLYGSNVADVVKNGETVVSYSYSDNGTTKYYPAAQTMAADIYADIKAGTSNRRYTTFNDDVINTTTNYKILEYMRRTTADDGDRISTFSTEQGGIRLPDTVNDFAVLVIATSDVTETTNFINRYIQLVTNTPNSGNTANFAADNEYYNLKIKACEYDPDTASFALTDDDPGLNWDKTNDTFSLDIDNADSLKSNRFTLLDVQFLDPFGKDKIAYHLYVPVYTVREMPVNFYSSAMTGDHSVIYSDSGMTNAYEALMSSACNHADVMDNWMTHYIRYEYQGMDINALLDTGNLAWGYQKSIKFDTFTIANDDTKLPDGTYMVLVDPNGNYDDVYYAKAEDMTNYTITGSAGTKNCWQVDFVKFKKSDGTTVFTAPSFNRMLAKSIEAKPSSGGNTGKYDVIAEEDIDADDTIIYLIDANGDKTYYKYNTNGNGAYNLKVDEGTEEEPVTYYEDYYISIYVPHDDLNKLYHYSVGTEVRLASTNVDYYDYEDTLLTSGDLPKERSAGVTKQNDCTILIADLFTQSVTKTVSEQTVSRMTVTPNNEQITANNKEITVDISTYVTPKNGNGIAYLDGISDMYHSFYITLGRHASNGTFYTIDGLGDEDTVEDYVTATYKIDDGTSKNCTNIELSTTGNYLNVQTTSQEDSSKLISKLRNQGYFEIASTIVMDFDEEELVNEFPERESGSSNHGVNVEAASNIAYNSEALSYSSISAKYPPDGKYYYRETVPSATLRYTSKADDMDNVEDKIGYDSGNRSTLGVNGRSAIESEVTKMLVNSQAYYNVQSLADASNAKWLKITFALNKKTDLTSGISYQPISEMQNYLAGDDKMVYFKVGQNGATVSVIPTGDKLTVWLNVSDYDLTANGNIYDIYISFYAKTGTGFTEYANYKVDLTVELYKDDEHKVNVENSSASDYLIYTNAKINPNILKAIQEAG